MKRIRLIIILYLFITVTILANDIPDYNTWIQVIYDSTNGFPMGTANTIEQTEDGILWIGTYGGLYRYNGTNFEWLNHSSMKQIYCLEVDDEGRMWVGSTTDGLSIIVNNEVVNVLNAKGGLPSNSILSILAGIDGDYYIGTTNSLAIVDLSEGLSIKKIIDDISYTMSLSKDSKGHIAAVTNLGELFILEGTKIIDKRTYNGEGENYSTCVYDENDNLYVGTTQNHIVKFKDDKIEKEISCNSLSNILKLKKISDNQIIICSDTGVGYLEKDTEHLINTNQYTSGICDALIDYQGNLWFTSNRMGLLQLCATPFIEVASKVNLPSRVVNAITKWQDNYYFGTDTGLEVVNGDLTEIVDSTLAKELDGVRIRCLLVDSHNNLWIATIGQGAWCVQENGNITKYDEQSGALENRFRMLFEQSDGTIILGGASNGMTFVENGVITDTFNYKENGIFAVGLCMLEKKDGTLLLGTDSQGIVLLKDRKVIKTYGENEGLTGQVVMRMAFDPKGEGIFIASGSHLNFMYNNEKIRTLTNFPYHNNFDIVSGNDNELFIPCSVGIYMVDRDELLSGEELEYTLLDYKKGLRDTLVPNSWSYLENSKLYLAGNTGVTIMNLNQYRRDNRSYRMHMKSIEIDDISYYVKVGETISIPSIANRIVLTPEIINYSVSDPHVRYYLEGLEVIPQECLLSELSSVVYNNLPVGEYIFHLDILDDRGKIISKNTYDIVKQATIYENTYFVVYMIVVFVLTIIYLSWMFFRTQLQKTLNLQKRELALAKNQLKMSNEAILTIARTVDAKDMYTSQHSLRVSKYARLVAEKLNFSKEECDELERAALLHDIGKISVPDSVLNKPSRLTDEEYAIMKNHVIKGGEILKDFTSVSHIVEGAKYHHERYDGKGYSSGLKGEEIPLYARIIGIADAFDAMTSNRVYRKKLDMDYVIDEIKKGRGTQFDPVIADIFLKLLDDGTIDVEKIHAETPENEEVEEKPQ